MPKLNVKKITKSLPEGYGIDKACGVWYFNGPDCHTWFTTCTNFCTLDQGTLQDWLEAFERCKGE